MGQHSQQFHLTSPRFSLNICLETLIELLKMASSSRLRMINCYDILEISPDTSLKDINSAYKKLALKHHPDKTKGDDPAIKFQKITEAVEILRNPTTRREHDMQLGRRYRPYSEEERLFTSPDYKGWKPNGIYGDTSVRKDRYMFSFGESVHMKPQSKESQEEIARWEITREDEVERENQEKIRRAAEESAAEESEAIHQRAWYSVWNHPESQEELPRFDRAREASAETEEQENIRIPAAKFIADDLTEDTDCQKAWRSVLNSDEQPFDVPRQTYNGRAYNGLWPVWCAGVRPNEESHGVLKTDPVGEAGIGPEAEVREKHEHELDPDAQSETDGNCNIASGLRFDLDAAPNVVPDTEGIAKFGMQPVDVLKADRDRDEHTSIHMESHQRNIEKDLPASDYSAGYTMSGAWPCSSEDTQVKANAISSGDTEDESAGSIYYDLSDAPPYRSCHSENEDHHDLCTEETSSVHHSDASPTPVWYDFAEFDEANVYPYLASFIPYFTSKLADKRGRYSKEDFYGELKGMIMETYCGWLETVRMTIPGAASSTNALDPIGCRHLGYWKKDLGHEECEECDLWRPIYTLVCPGCGIKRCVRCKFNEAE
ncbi:DnaJ domain protein [Aspergillus foveolatus]|uniref:DnaJ domain protein n=1 Tax=Aspergillus foveolatus TaxID=210207 RepID=UPI003CCCC139